MEESKGPSEEQKAALENIKVNPRRNFIVKLETIAAFKVFQEKELIRRYNNFSRYITKKYFSECQKEEFWQTMSTAMLVYDHKLSYKDFHLGICDEFSDGVYLPKEKQIILCSNTLTNRKDFENALYRQLIKFYDDLRSDNYNFNS